MMVADPTTLNSWEEGISDPNDPRSNGRMWIDKSVSTSAVELNVFGGGTVEVTPDNADEFLVELSALSSAQQVNGEPLDVVLVLDISGSMIYNMEGGGYTTDMDTLSEDVNGLVATGAMQLKLITTSVQLMESVCMKYSKRFGRKFLVTQPPHM